MILEVEKVFDSYLGQFFAEKPEILRYLRLHERKQIVIRRVCEQIVIAEKSNIRKKFDSAKHSYLIGECAKMFANAALNKAQQDNLSKAERERLVAKATYIDTIKADFDAEQKEFEERKLVSYPGQVAR